MASEETTNLIEWHLDQIINQKGISGKELAKNVDVHPNTISRLRNTENNKMPSINGDLLGRLCQNLDCTPEDLIQYIPTKFTSTQQKTEEYTENRVFQIATKIFQSINFIVEIPKDKVGDVMMEIFKILKTI